MRVGPRPILGEMMVGDAACGSARHRMALPDIMAGDAADDRALDTAFGVGRRGGEGHGKSGGSDYERAEHGRYSFSKPAPRTPRRAAPFRDDRRAALGELTGC